MVDWDTVLECTECTWTGTAGEADQENGLSTRSRTVILAEMRCPDCGGNAVVM